MQDFSSATFYATEPQKMNDLKKLNKDKNLVCIISYSHKIITPNMALSSRRIDSERFWHEISIIIYIAT
jgi:hypothetical protein